jgi:PhnB protein
MEHVGVVVDDLAAATAFCAELVLEPQSEGPSTGAWVGRVVGLEGVRVDYAMMDTPEGDGRIEVVKFRAPPGHAGRIAKSGEGATMTSIQPELWVENVREALAFYAAAFGATVLHLVGEGDEIVAQLGVGDAAFWIAPAASTMKRLDPRAIDGATSRTLLVVDDPDTVTAQAVRAGAKETSPVGDEHGWRLGRIIDPFGHEWEIGKPLGPWPPT